MFPEKFVRDYVRQYDKEFDAAEAEGKGRPIRDMDAYLADCLHTYKNYCQDKEPAGQILIWLQLLCDPEYPGYKAAFLSGDPALLHKVLFQSAVIRQAGNILSPGFDHCFNVWIALYALAAGLNERVALLLPGELGLSSNGHPVTVAVANLLMALWYRQKDFAAAARQNAFRVLTTKQPASSLAEIRYLVALLDENPSEAGAQLELYCRGVSGIKDWGVTKLSKMFWPRAHGYYNLAFAVWDREKALALPWPESDCFCKALAQWQREQDFRPGDLFFEYPAPLELVNKILRCPPPACTLEQPYLHTKERFRKQYYLNVESFRERMIAVVLADLQS